MYSVDSHIVDFVAIERAARAERARFIAAMVRSAGQWISARVAMAFQNGRAA